MCEGRRVMVDVERGRTVEGWLPRRLGGGRGPGRQGQSRTLLLARTLLSSLPFSRQASLQRRSRGLPNTKVVERVSLPSEHSVMCRRLAETTEKLKEKEKEEKADKKKDKEKEKDKA